MTWRNGPWWVVAGVLLLGLMAGCGSKTSTGAGPAGSDPAQALSYGSQQALTAGSARFAGTTTYGAQQSISFDGTLSWSGGMTGEMTMTGTGQPAPTVARFTQDALYTSLPAGMPPPMSDYRWGKYSYSDMTSALGPVGEAFRAVLAQTNPVRSAAILRQAGDLRLVGEEQRNGIAATHYAGTIEPSKLLADLKLGLTDQVLAELRAEAQRSGMTSEHVDVWLDEKGFPIHAEERASDPSMGQILWTADYRDYGVPQQVSPPPPDQVYDLGARLNTPLPEPPPR